MTVLENQQYDEERALYGSRNVCIRNCKFDGPADGESALKECEDIVVEDCFFNLRYPFWHVQRAQIKNATMTDLCRAALWYDDDIAIDGSTLGGIKALRECSRIRLTNSTVDSTEFLWRCQDVEIVNTTMKSEYPLFECRNVKIDNLNMKGKYSFQYVENMEIHNSYLDTKDAFWHSNHVTVYDSVVKGEYLGWYASNLKFVRCKIIGTQPLCYCKNLILEDCTMEGTDFSFERSEVQATIQGSIEGVKNPLRGRIQAEEIKDLILEEEYIDPSNTIFELGV